MSNSRKLAVLLLAHGSPESAEEMPEYLARVTSGRPLPPEIGAEIARRYSLVGFSPLRCWTEKQAAQLSSLLNLPVYVGMRNWKPFIAEAVHSMAQQEIQHAVVICLAPQNSRTSVGLYRRALESANPPFTFDFVESWHNHPLLIQAFAEKLRRDWTKASAEAGTQLPVIFTAHSVPQRTITDGDPYQAQAHETAELVAKSSAIEQEWVFAFQSQGMSGGAWIGPTVEETILALKQRGHLGIFLEPIGFLCDHVEVLYDIDIQFRQFAEQHGMRLWRAESLNDSPTLTSALADIAQRRMNGETSS